jgi:hypothetical protein
MNNDSANAGSSTPKNTTYSGPMARENSLKNASLSYEEGRKQR